jgi:hypothetical protein
MIFSHTQTRIKEDHSDDVGSRSAEHSEVDTESSLAFTEIDVLIIAANRNKTA